MSKITFRKLFYRLKESDYGAYVESIIVLEKRPLRYRIDRLSPWEAIERKCDSEIIYTQYCYLLQIDLWIVVLRFEWEGKFKDDKAR